MVMKKIGAFFFGSVGVRIDLLMDVGLFSDVASGQGASFGGASTCVPVSMRREGIARGRPRRENVQLMVVSCRRTSISVDIVAKLASSPPQ